MLVGKKLTYTLKVTNSGPATSTAAMLTDMLPGSVTFVSGDSTQGSCSEAGGVVTCSLGDLGIGAMATTTITILPTAGGTITNSATVEGAEPDPDLTNNTAEAVTKVEVCGDQNDDGLVNVVDAIIDLQIAVGLIEPSEAQLRLSDLNRDGSITVVDAIIGLQHIVGLVPGLDQCGLRRSRNAFASDREGDLDIYVMDADGSNQVNLTDNSSGDNVPDWSPDGSKIAFSSGRDSGGQEIYVMDADGSN